MDLAERHIAEPFFDETIKICLSRMRNRSFYTPLSNPEFVVEAASKLNGIAPAAFIFHVSRCGSTLLTQALSTDISNIVYAEAPLLDEILRASYQDKKITAVETERWFKAVIQMMGQQRKSQYQHLFIKLDSWHIHFYPLLRKWFPDTPFYFLTRKPDAVILSHHKRRGLHSIPGMIETDLLKVKLDDRHYRDFNFFTAQVLENYYQSIHNLVIAHHSLDHFYDYSWGMDNLFAHFFSSIGKENAHEAEMHKRLSFHSKYPDQPFGNEINIDLPIYDGANSAYQDLIVTLLRKRD
ncbi:hypothetical protein ACN1CD_20765 [Pedobacter sp. N23S346]